MSQMASSIHRRHRSQTRMTEIRLLLTAVQYFTRIRVPAWVGHAPERLTGAVRYSRVGLIVGASGAAVLWLAALVLPAPLPAILCTAVTVLMTGAIHEDGLADTSDGIGGGATPGERALEIMKDPRIGAFGAIALMLACCSEDRDAEPDAAMDCNGSIARRARVFAILCGDRDIRRPVCRQRRPSRAAPARGANHNRRRAHRSAFRNTCARSCSARTRSSRSSSRSRWWVCWSRWCVQRLGGYTGDTLGAAQQVTEIGCYVALLGMSG